MREPGNAHYVLSFDGIHGEKVEGRGERDNVTLLPTQPQTSMFVSWLQFWIWRVLIQY